MVKDTLMCCKAVVIPFTLCVTIDIRGSEYNFENFITKEM